MAKFKNIVATTFDIRSGEELPLALLLVHSFFLGASLVFFETPANTLFLQKFSMVVMALTLLGLAASATRSWGQTGERIGTVLAVDGAAEARAANTTTWEPLQFRAAIFAQDTVRTGADSNEESRVAQPPPTSVTQQAETIIARGQSLSNALASAPRNTSPLITPDNPATQAVIQQRQSPVHLIITIPRSH